MTAGTDTSSTLAPAAASASAAARVRASTSGAMPSPIISVMIPTRRPVDPVVEVVRHRRERPGDRRRIARIVSTDDLADRSGVGDGGGERADLVERRAERDQAEPRHQPVGGLDPDHAAQRSGLADRAARVRAQGDRGEPGCHGGRDPPDDPPGTRVVSCGLSVGPKAEFSVDEPMANSSMLVLPTATAPAAANRVTTVASYGGSQPSRILDEQVVGTPRVQRLSLRATGTPASGPGSRPSATAASTARAASRAASSVTWLKAWISRVGLGDAGEVAVEHLDGGRFTGPNRGGDVDRACGARIRSSRVTEDGRDPEPAVLGRRSRSEHLVTVERNARNVGPEHVDEWDRAGPSARRRRGRATPCHRRARGCRRAGG